MILKFSKYQGTGNDFVMVNDMDELVGDISIDVVKQICERRFGVGADGLIVIKPHDLYDFEMVYYNSDGSQSFCGNGARCTVMFAKDMGVISDKTTFLAIDGRHTAHFENDLVALQMNDVNVIKETSGTFELNTGSPHYVKFTKKLDEIDILNFGKQIRYSEQYCEAGINVNLVEETENGSLKMLTYERGVEAETFSCGTGATAVALSAVFKDKMKGDFKKNIAVKGGKLLVSGSFDGKLFTNISLIGPAKNVFNGRIEIG